MDPSPYRAPFTSAHARANIVKILLVVGAIVTGLSMVIEAISLAVPPLTEDQELGDNPMAIGIGLLLLLVGVLSILLYVATVIFFLVWVYRASDNLPAFGNSPRSLGYSPGWTVGSFFVPFVNLVVPYRAIKELWQKSVPIDEVPMSEPGPPTWFPIWWLFWLLAGFSANISLRLSFNENVPETTATIVSIIAGALSIIAAVLAYVVVDEIDKRQEETSRKLGLGKFTGPPPNPPSPFNLPMPDPGMRQ